MAHVMVRPGFPGYAAYPYQGPRLMARLEGGCSSCGLGQLGPAVVEPEQTVEAPLVSTAGSAIYTEVLWHSLYSALVGGAGGFLLARRPVAGAFLGAGAGVLFHAAFPPSPVVGTPFQGQAGAMMVATGRAVPSKQGRLALAALGLGLLGAGYYFRKR